MFLYEFALQSGQGSLEKVKEWGTVGLFSTWV